MKNEILEDLWKSKDEIAKKYRYNIDKLAAELRKKEKVVKAAVVDFTSDSKSMLATDAICKKGLHV